MDATEFFHRVEHVVSAGSIAHRAVHHCAYTDVVIQHCIHGMHHINRQIVIGSLAGGQEYLFEFSDPCGDGWHVESGFIRNEQ